MGIASGVEWRKNLFLAERPSLAKNPMMAQDPDNQENSSQAEIRSEFRILVALGSNCRTEFGSPEETLRVAISALAGNGITVGRVSGMYRSPAFPPGNGPDYVNAAVACSGTLSPDEVLAALGQIENDLGRTRKTRWAPRTVDLDLIGMGNAVLPDAATHEFWRGLGLEEQQKQVPDQLILPHPRVQDRAFVLVPLADVAPDWVHPVLNKSVRFMLKELSVEMRNEVQEISHGPAA